jgi:hypothetical protein
LGRLSGGRSNAPDLIPVPLNSSVRLSSSLCAEKNALAASPELTIRFFNVSDVSLLNLMRRKSESAEGAEDPFILFAPGIACTAVELGRREAKSMTSEVKRGASCKRAATLASEGRLGRP